MLVSAETVVPETATPSRPEDPLWAAIGTLSSKAGPSGPSASTVKRLPLAVESPDRPDTDAQRKLAGLAAAGLLAPSWVAAMQPAREQPNPGVTPRRRKSAKQPDHANGNKDPEAKE
jgi:hypothetical protein